MESFDSDENDSWMRHYESDFPATARCFLSGIFDNWERWKCLYDEQAMAERIIHDLNSKVDALPITELNRVTRKEIKSFIRKNDPLDLYRLCEYHRNLELGSSPNEMANQRTVVRSFQEHVNEADQIRKSLSEKLSEIFNLQKWHAISPNDQLLEDIRTYKNVILPNLVQEVEQIHGFIEESMSVLLNYQSSESKYLQSFFKELRNSWKILIDTITILQRLVANFDNQFFPLLQNRVGESDPMWEDINQEGIFKALDDLISNSLIITEFPSWNERSLRAKKKKFMMTLEVLLPFDLFTTDPKVDAYLLTEEGYARMKTTSYEEAPLDTDLAVNSLYQYQCNIQKDKTLKTLKATFQELGFDGKVNRKRTKEKQVMFLKHVYLFRTKLTCFRRTIWSRCFSLPVAISSHNDQNIEGSSALFWDAHYRRPGAIGLETRDDVSWSEISNAIGSMIFAMTGRKPTQTNMKFLRKLFMGPQASEIVDDEETIFKQKDLLRQIDDNNTFWDWLMHTVNTIKKKETVIGSLWSQGYFVGYIDQLEAAEVIKTALTVLSDDPKKNCFLLRFSKRCGKDIVLQGFLEGPSTYGIYSVDPYKPEMLRETTLEDRVMSRIDCHKLLYEDINNGWAAIAKEKVFETFLKEPSFEDLPSGYVPRKVVEYTPKCEETDSSIQ